MLCSSCTDLPTRALSRTVLSVACHLLHKLPHKPHNCLPLPHASDAVQFVYQFAYTDPQKDTAVSGDMERAQLIEPPISKVCMGVNGCGKSVSQVAAGDMERVQLIAAPISKVWTVCSTLSIRQHDMTVSSVALETTALSNCSAFIQPLCTLLRQSMTAAAAPSLDPQP